MLLSRDWSLKEGRLLPTSVGVNKWQQRKVRIPGTHFMIAPEPSPQPSCFPYGDFTLDQGVIQAGLSSRVPVGLGVPGAAWGPRGDDGWVPYGFPQLPLLVQLALQAARTLLRGIRLLLQAPDLSPHRLQRAATRHGEAAAEAVLCLRALRSAAATAAAAVATEPRSGSSRPGRLCNAGAPCG